MSEQFREYVEAKLEAVEKEATRLRTALDVLEGYEADRPEPARTEKAKPDPKKSDPPAGTRSRAGKKECSKKGCNALAVCKGMCRKHYQRALKAEKEKAAADSSNSAAPEREKAVSSNGVDPDPPIEIAAAIVDSYTAPDQHGARIECYHPHCKTPVPWNDAALHEPQYCSEYCRNNHAKLVGEV